MHKTKFVAIIAMCGISLGCAPLPDEWSEQLTQSLRCDMSITDVEFLSKRRVLDESRGQSWTHFIRAANTDVLLAFSEGKLKGVQVSWLVKMTQYAYYQPIQLCDEYPIPNATMIVR